MAKYFGNPTYNMQTHLNRHTITNTDTDNTNANANLNTKHIYGLPITPISCAINVSPNSVNVGVPQCGKTVQTYPPRLHDHPGALRIPDPLQTCRRDMGVDVHGDATYVVKSDINISSLEETTSIISPQNDTHSLPDRDSNDSKGYFLKGKTKNEYMFYWFLKKKGYFLKGNKKRIVVGGFIICLYYFFFLLLVPLRK